MTNFAMPTGVLNIGHISRVDSLSKELELLWLCVWFFFDSLMGQSSSGGSSDVHLGHLPAPHFSIA